MRRLPTALLLLAIAPSAVGAPLLIPHATGFRTPVDIAAAADGSGRLYVVEQSGAIRTIQNGTRLAAPFLDLTAAVSTGGERGLLGLAFHPSHAGNGYFFVNYTRASDGATIIARFQRSLADPSVADPNSEKILLLVPQPFANHNGGALKFGQDGLLYIALGDGGSANDPFSNAQNLNSLLGKILRIDVDSGDPYAIPQDNPFAGDGDPNTLAEIWAHGLRNPWRMSFDRSTGGLFIGDVGQDQIEEIDLALSGSGPRNFGWRPFEGTRCTGLDGAAACQNLAALPPILQYTHAEGCSVTGGFVYRGRKLPYMEGRYLFSDFCSGTVWQGTQDNASQWNRSVLLQTSNQVSAFGEDEAGELYLADYLTGTIFRVWDHQRHADLDGNGKADILWRNKETGAQQLWLMNGAVRSALVSVPGSAPASGWRIAATGDANGDGRSDIFWRNTSGSNYLWLMDSGSVVGQGSLPFVADPAWEIVAAADFNADGKSDLLWRNATTGANQLWLMNGTTRASVVSVPTVLPGSGWRIAALGDANADGKADIFWRNVSGSNYLWLMDSGSVSAQGSLPALLDAAWDLAGAADFNADGKADLLWRHATTGANQLWLMNGTTRTAALSVPTVAPDSGWKLAALGDANGDGMTDIFWRNTSGSNYLWLMNGASVTSPAPLPFLADFNWEVVGR